MIDPIVGLKLYMAVKLHFTSKYDIFEYGGRVPNISSDSLNKISARKALILRLCKRFKTNNEMVQYLVSQYAYTDNSALYDPMIAEENFDRWNKNKISMTQIILDDLYEKDVKEIIMGPDPKIFRMIVGGSVNIESATALNNILDFVKEDYFVFNNIAVKIKKLRRFIRFDKERVIKECNIYHETA